MLGVVRNQDLNEEENFISSSAHPEDIYSTCALARIHPVYLYKTVTSSSMSMACESSRNPCHFTLDVISSIKKIPISLEMGLYRTQCPWRSYRLSLITVIKANMSTCRRTIGLSPKAYLMQHLMTYEASTKQASGMYLV
jgi:hypothetical protein